MAEFPEQDPKVIIIGPYPPPFGGISVHVQRMHKLLAGKPVLFLDTDEEGEKDRPDNVLPLNRKQMFWLIRQSSKVIHYHSSSLKMRLWLGVCALFNSSIYIHVHGASLKDALSLNNWKSKLLKVLFRRMHLLSSNPDIDQLGRKELNARSYHVIDAFLPPVYDEQEMRETEKLIQWPKTKYVIGMTGWFVRYKNEDLYGFDLMVSALKQLREKGLDVGSVASVNGIKDHDLHDAFVNRIEEENLNDFVVLIHETLPEMYPLIVKSDLFVRPTNSDGNAVSIKEALWFDTPVVASDCVPRPDGVHLFNDRDAVDLSHRIEEVLKHLPKKSEEYSPGEKEFTHPLIDEIYGFNE